MVEFTDNNEPLIGRETERLVAEDDAGLSKKEKRKLIGDWEK